MLYHVTVGARTFEVRVGSEGVLVDGTPVEAELSAMDATPVRSLRLDGASYRLVAGHPGRGAWSLHMRSRRLEAEVVDERTRVIRDMTGAGAAASGPKPVVAPMPGLVVKIEVSEGDEVREGQGIVIVEAMKMENELKAEAAGTVAKVHVAAGDTVEKGQILVDFEAPTDEDAS